MDSITERFSRYFDRELAQAAARSLNDGVQMEFRVGNEVFTFTKAQGRNQIQPGAAKEPQLLFTISPSAAEAILTDPADDIGTIGINIMKLVLSPDASKKVTVQFKAGFLTLFSQGYLGVLATGGAQFASYLASKGLGGMGAIKAALKKLRD